MSNPDPASPGASSRNTRPRKKSRKKLYVVLVILAVALIAVLIRAANPPKKGIRVTVEKSAVRTITQLVTATGKIQPETEVKISPEVAGEIIDLPVKEGQTVKKGDLLLKIKPDNYKAQVEQQQAALAAAKAASLQAKAQLDKARQDFQDSDDLFKKGVVSTSDHNAAKATYEMAKANYEASEAQISRAQGSLNQAMDLLSKTTIYSPMDGTISLLSSEVGERVVATSQFAGTEVMRIADLDHMEAQVDVNEDDVVHVKVGDKAQITIDAFGDRKFVGHVTEIASTATVTGQNTQDQVTNFEVKIRVDNPGVALRPGMSASADIETATVKNVVSVPIQSVTVRSIKGGKTMEQLNKEREQKERQLAGGAKVDMTDLRAKKDDDLKKTTERVVFVKQGDHVKMQPVETGIADNTYIQIKKGVSPGEEVVSGTYAAISRLLKDGMQVELEKPVHPSH